MNTNMTIGMNPMRIGAEICATLLLATILTVGAHAAQEVAQDADGAHHATTLSTPPLVPDGNGQLDCYIINVSKKPRNVAIDALNRAGDVVASWTGTLDAGTEGVAIAKAAETPRSCRFVVDGESKDFRASGLVVLPGVGSISALAAQ